MTVSHYADSSLKHINCPEILFKLHRTAMEQAGTDECKWYEFEGNVYALKFVVGDRSCSPYICDSKPKISRHIFLRAKFGQATIVKGICRLKETI